MTNKEKIILSSAMALATAFLLILVASLLKVFVL